MRRGRSTFPSTTTTTVCTRCDARAWCGDVVCRHRAKPTTSPHSTTSTHAKAACTRQTPTLMTSKTVSSDVTKWKRISSVTRRLRLFNARIWHLGYFRGVVLNSCISCLHPPNTCTWFSTHKNYVRIPTRKIMLPAKKASNPTRCLVYISHF